MSVLRDSMYVYKSAAQNAELAYGKLESRLEKSNPQLLHDAGTVLDFRVTPYIKHMEAAIELLERRIETLERRR